MDQLFHKVVLRYMSMSGKQFLSYFKREDFVKKVISASKNGDITKEQKSRERKQDF